MPQAIEVIAGRVTNPGATITPLTANTNSSFTVRSFAATSRAVLDNMWSHSATAGIFRIRSPRLHDASQGIRVQVGDTVPRLLLPGTVGQPVYSSDTLTVEGSGGGAETDAFYYTLYYNDLGGISARLAMPSEISPRIVDLAGIEVDVTTSATAGDWSAGTAINASFDTFKADTDYALLGYTTSVALGAIAISGSDTGNLKVGGPGPLDAIETNSWFMDQSMETGRPYIPIINSNNRGSTFLFVSDPAVSTAARVSLLFAQLSQ